MALLLNNRALWISRFILPCERGLRLWLANHTSLARQDVDDVVQETYAVLASLHSIEHIRHPRNYMFQTAKSILLQQLRRSKIIFIGSLNETDTLEIPTADAGPDDVSGQQQQLLFVATLIASLPRQCREAFTLRKFYGLSQREISQKLGISENIVEKHIAKGIRLLMDAFKQSDNLSHNVPPLGTKFGTLDPNAAATRAFHRD